VSPTAKKPATAARGKAAKPKPRRAAPTSRRIQPVQAPPTEPAERVYEPAPATVVAPPPRAGDGWEFIAAATFLVFLVVVHAGVSVFTGYPWYFNLLDTVIYAVPCGGAMALFGFVHWRTGALARVVSAALVGLAVLVALVVGGDLRTLILYYFILFLPLWAVLGVTGTARFRWSFLQFLGATLVCIAVWRPLHGSFPALTQLATASGVLRAYTVPEMYTIVSHKLLHETFLIVAGLLLLVNRFPWLQKTPESGDWRATLTALNAQSRFRPALTLALGATAFAVALIGSLVLDDLLSRTAVGQAGADDTRVFERITPGLVVLLSFAAGAGEELIFRGVLQPTFERAFRRLAPTLVSAVLAIIAQAVLFGVVHAGYGNWIHVLLPFGFGLLTGLTCRLLGIGPAIYAHFMIDVFAFGYDASQRYDWVNPALNVLLYANLIAGIAAPIWLAVDYVLGRRRRLLAQPAETSLYPAPKP